MNTNTKFGKLSEKLKRALEKKLKLDNLNQMLGGGISKRVAQINRDIDILLLNPSYVELIDPLKEHRQLAEERIQRERKTGIEVDYTKEGYFNSEQIRKYITGKSGLKTYNACALAAFSGIKPHLFPFLKDGATKEENSDSYTLEGAWDAYLYDSNKKAIKKTCLWLDVNSKDHRMFIPKFVTPWRSIYGGTGRLTDNNTLVLELFSKDVDVPIYICAELPELPYPETNTPIILNAGGLTSGRNNPVMGNLVLVKNHDENDREDFINKGINDVHFNEYVYVSMENKNTNTAYLVNQIIIYLTRHKDIPIKAFIPNKISEVEERNNKYLEKRSRMSFDVLNKIFSIQQEGYAWYSFSRIPKRNDRIGVFEWKFKPQQERQDVKVRRYRINHPKKRLYEGEVIVQSDHIYMNLQDKKKENSKNFISDIPDEQEPPIKLRGISATTSIKGSIIESKRIGVKEILVYMPELSTFESRKLEAGYVDYDQFLKIDDNFLTLEDKLYLAHRELSITTYKSRASHKSVFGRQKDALKFSGDYYLFVRDIYQTNEDSLFISPLSIDTLGKVDFEVYYKEEKQDYSGYIESYSSNLIIRLEHLPDIQAKEKIMTLLFDPVNYSYIQKPQLFSGLIADTNDDNWVGSYPFIMIPKSRLNISSFENIIFDKEMSDERASMLIDELNPIMREHFLPIGDIDSYFFKPHPLGRFSQKGN